MFDLHSSLVRVVVVALGVLAACALGYLLGSSRRAPEDVGQERSAGPDPAEADPQAAQALERLNAASARFGEALGACDGPRQRLVRLAESASAMAGEMWACGPLGIVPAPSRISAGWQPPRELRRDGLRLPVAAWRGVDRAFDALIATLDDPAGDLLARAVVFDELAGAAARVAGLARRACVDRRACRLHVLWQAQQRVRKVIAGPEALICDECVELCVEILEDEIGQDWRSPDDDG